MGYLIIILIAFRARIHHKTPQTSQVTQARSPSSHARTSFLLRTISKRLVASLKYSEGVQD